MMASQEIHMEGGHSIRTHMIEMCIHLHPLSPCCLNLEGFMMMNIQLLEITEGTKGLGVETVRSFTVTLKTGTAALTKVERIVERIAMREIVIMIVTAMIRTMRKAGEMVAGEGVIYVRVNMKEEG